MSFSSINTPRQSGITMIELLVVMSVMGIIITLVLNSLGDFYQSNLDAVSKTTQTNDTRTTLKFLQLELTKTADFLAESDAATPLTTPLGADDGTATWNYKGNDPTKPANRVLISKAYATDKAPTDATRNLVYTGGCTAGVDTPLMNNVIYFAKKDTTTNKYNLYRRTIRGPGTPCVTPYQKQTCAATKVSANASVCQASDAVLLYDIEEFKVDYFTNASDASPLANQYPASGNADLTNIKTVQLSVTTNRKVGGVDSPYTATIRVSRAN